MPASEPAVAVGLPAPRYDPPHWLERIRRLLTDDLAVVCLMLSGSPDRQSRDWLGLLLLGISAKVRPRQPALAAEMKRAAERLLGPADWSGRAARFLEAATGAPLPLSARPPRKRGARATARAAAQASPTGDSS